ncbi:biliverdin-producing heme oxygenase [Paracoccus sp. T5]|uniref:biliverdin-producing heme oxygenase n=1 Tax=Paracoccus sp. T5 TaxID=3402161 RepID=UPI003AE1EBAD
MQSSARRQALRAGTDDLHRLLDDQLGDLTQPRDYHRYLAGTWAFRAALEPALTAALTDAGQSWRLLPLAEALQADLRDLDQPLPALPPVPDLTHPATQTGALYVLEGSALGARLVAARAADLGFDATFAARHLARQTEDKTRFRSFLTWLDTAAFDAEASAEGARGVFRMAIRAHGLTPTDAFAAQNGASAGG